MIKTFMNSTILLAAAAALSFGQPAQGPPPPPQAPGAAGPGVPGAPAGPDRAGPPHPRQGPGGPPQLRRDGGGRAFGPGGKWWDNPETAKRLNITTDQQKKMDNLFQQYRVKLIDLHATLAKEEATLDPLMSADTLDDAKILPQIDRIAQARAELEKTNSRMFLGMRHILTPEQSKALAREPHPRRP